MKGYMYSHVNYNTEYKYSFLLVDNNTDIHGFVYLDCNRKFNKRYISNNQLSKLLYTSLNSIIYHGEII